MLQMYTLNSGFTATGDFSSALFEFEVGEGGDDTSLKESKLEFVSGFLDSDVPSFEEVVDVFRFRFLGSLALVDAVRASINVPLSNSIAVR